MTRVVDKVAIVRGGGAGIGRASCIRLAEEGAKVMVADIGEERGKETVEETKGNGGEGRFLGHDVSQEEQWEPVVRQTRETFRRIDVLVKDAGNYLIKPVAETTL